MLPVAWKPPPSLGHSQPRHHHQQPLFIIISLPKCHPGLLVCLLVGGFFVVVFIIYNEKTQSVTVKPGDSGNGSAGRRCVAVLGTGIEVPRGRWGQEPPALPAHTAALL